MTKPHPPAHTETAPLAPKTTKNYVHDNFVQTITAPPKKPEPYYIDSTHGKSNRFPLEESGLAPKYVNKKAYGKVPEYLSQRDKVRDVCLRRVCSCYMRG